MIDKTIWILWPICLVGAGTYFWLRPATVSEKIKAFYSVYSLIRLAGEKQLESRSVYVKLLGAVFIVLGIMIFLINIFH